MSKANQLFLFCFAFTRWTGSLVRNTHLALPLDSLGLISEIQLIHFGALLKEVLWISLHIQRIPESASSPSTVPELVQRASMVGFWSLNASSYQQYQSKFWYQTDTSGSGSVLAHVLSMQTAPSCIAHFAPSPPPLCSIVMQSCDSPLRDGGQLLERGVSKHRDLNMDLLSKLLQIICSRWHRSAHFVSRECLYWCQDPQHWLCNYLISDH